MLSCRDSSELLSRSLDEPLPFGTRVGLRFHLLICRFCRRYGRQIRALDRIARGWAASAPARPGGLSEERKESLRAALRG